MTHPLPFGGVLPRGLVVASTVLVWSLFGSVALAGECPADKARANATKPVTHAAKGVTDTTLAAIDLGKEPAKIAGRELRFRKLTIEPGGIVPWHSHGDRPAMIYVVSGEVTEYASTCAVPIVHRAGEVAAERAPTSHWWQNTGKASSVLISVDLFRIDDKVNEKMM